MKLPEINWSGQLVTIPWILHSLYSALETANTKIQHLYDENNSLKQQINSLDIQKLDTVYKANQHLETITGFMQNNIQYQHGLITENKADIVTNKNKYLTLESSVHNLISRQML